MKNNMNWKKAAIFGVFLWILMFVIVSVFVAFDIYKFGFMGVVTALIAGKISHTLAKKVKPDKASLALSYGLTWVIIGIILDTIVTTRFNSGIFSSWSLWLGYSLVLLAPLLIVKKK
jgi:hypothetical protein